LIIRYVAISIFTIFLCVPNGGFAADVYLQVTKGGGGKIGIAISDFIPQDHSTPSDNLSPEIREIINNDLEMSGLFDPVKNPLFIKEASARDQKEGRIVFNEWALLGAQALVKGNYSSINSSPLTMEFHLYEVTSGRRMVEKKYKGETQLLRLMAHKIADEIIYQFTGERGTAQTKIAFISVENGSKDLYYMDYDGHNPRRLTRNKSLTLSPANQDALVLMGAVLLRRGDVENAREHAIWAIRIDPTDRGALHLMGAIKAKTSWFLGLWWRYNTWCSEVGSKNAAVVLLGAFILYRFLTQFLVDFDRPQGAELVSYAWLGICIYSWVGPGIFQRELQKELQSVQLRKGF